MIEVFEEARKVHAGKNLKWVILAGVATFLIGVLDGFLRPLKCNK